MQEDKFLWYEATQCVVLLAAGLEHCGPVMRWSLKSRRHLAVGTTQEYRGEGCPPWGDI